MAKYLLYHGVPYATKTTPIKNNQFHFDPYNYF